MINILYVCFDNAGCSPMAEAITNRLAAQRGISVHAQSAGLIAANEMPETVQRVMAEIGISMMGYRPKAVALETISNANHIVIISFGVNANALMAWAAISLDAWEVGDILDQPIKEVRSIRNEIERRVVRLLNELACSNA
ncbi:MAG: hypothetical protein P4L33_06235 [Capsulimonadaceae bacterium]|nr:hypothetical protein [Capsulimonadaceae bacterium]